MNTTTDLIHRLKQMGKGMETKEQYPESELTYKLIGIAYEVYNNIGAGFHEKIYQSAYEKELQSKKIRFKRELYCNFIYKNSKIGRFFIDFLIDEKVVVEIKARGDIVDKDMSQTLAYMKLNNIKVGLILLFGEKVVKKKRLIL